MCASRPRRWLQRGRKGERARGNDSQTRGGRVGNTFCHPVHLQRPQRPAMDPGLAPLRYGDQAPNPRSYLQRPTPHAPPSATARPPAPWPRSTSQLDTVRLMREAGEGVGEAEPTACPPCGLCGVTLQSMPSSRMLPGVGRWGGGAGGSRGEGGKGDVSAMTWRGPGAREGLGLGLGMA